MTIIAEHAGMSVIPRIAGVVLTEFVVLLRKDNSVAASCAHPGMDAAGEGALT